MKGKIITLDEIGQQDKERTEFQIARILVKYNRYERRVNDAKYRQELLEKIKQQRKTHKNPITSLVINHVLLIINSQPPTVFILTFEEALSLCQQFNVACTKTHCFLSMKAAAAGLGAKIMDCKVSFNGSELTVRKKVA